MFEWMAGGLGGEMRASLAKSWYSLQAHAAVS